jgi:uncharacterized membrane protein YccF (DUF307 family)
MSDDILTWVVWAIFLIGLWMCIYYVATAIANVILYFFKDQAFYVVRLIKEKIYVP